MSLPLPRVPAEVSPRDRERALEVVSRHEGVIDGHLARLRALPAQGNRVMHMDQLFLGLTCAYDCTATMCMRVHEDCE